MENENWKREWVMMSNRLPFQSAMDELIDAAQYGYKTDKGFVVFMYDVQDFLVSACRGPYNPHSWDKLLRRAQKHDCNVELRGLKETFEHERAIHRRYANEGLDEFERSMRGQM